MENIDPINDMFTRDELEKSFYKEGEDKKRSIVKPLPEILNKNGHTYKLIRRGEKSLIYGQWCNEKLIAYEVFQIRIKKEYYLKGKLIEARERFPHDEAFGSWAFIVKYLDSAIKISNKLEQK